MELTVAVTGASGTIYAQRTLQLLAESGAVQTINLIMSSVVPTVAQVELGVNLKDLNQQKINKWLGLDEKSKANSLLAVGQSGGETFERLKQTSRNDYRAVFDGNARRNRFGCGNESDSPCGGCLYERAEKARYRPA